RLPRLVHNLEPFRSAGIAIVVLVEVDTVFLRFFRPPGRHYIQRDPPSADVVDIGGLFGEQGRIMESGPHGHHQFESLGYSSQRRGRRPGIERRRFGSLDVIQVQLGNQGEIKSDFFAATGEAAYILPTRLHVFVFNVAEPPAKHWKPISVAHHAASFSRKSTRRVKGSKPTRL